MFAHLRVRKPHLRIAFQLKHNVSMVFKIGSGNLSGENSHIVFPFRMISSKVRLHPNVKRSSRISNTSNYPPVSPTPTINRAFKKFTQDCAPGGLKTAGVAPPIIYVARPHETRSARATPHRLMSCWHCDTYSSFDNCSFEN